MMEDARTRYLFECECNGEIPLPEHKAIQYGDEMQCHRCGKAWDVKDPEPPECESRHR